MGHKEKNYIDQTNDLKKAVVCLCTLVIVSC